MCKKSCVAIVPGSFSTVIQYYCPVSTFSGGAREKGEGHFAKLMCRFRLVIIIVASKILRT